MKQALFQIKIYDEHNQQRTGYAHLPKGYPEKRRKYLRKYARMKAIKRIGYYATITASILFWGWILLSWIDVISHNRELHPIYQAWNFFELFY